MKLKIVAAVAAIGLAAYAKAPAIGYMLDISRDKVPTMASLRRMVDVLSALGYNQFQLYTEHTFAYKAHATVWADASPMTAEEIRELDAYCRDRGIELVPNQNSFGHLEKWFKHPEYRPLAEAPYGGVKTSWKSTMVVPRALCPTDPQSIAFIASLYDELLPNFTSKLFNVGCDEVWELESAGMGRSWDDVSKTSRQKVWIDYFKKVVAEAEKRGRTVMFWDDMVVRRHPELIPELPKNAIALEGGYELKKGIDACIYERDCANLAKNCYRFYVCPGSSTWNAITGRHFNMKTNVDEAVSAGLKYGAEGFLMCDWGNGGMCQPWITALPSLIYMRAKIDGKTLTDDEIAAKVDGIAGAKCGQALIRYQNLYRLSGDPNPFNRNTIHQLLSNGMNVKPRGMTDQTIAAVAAEHAAAKGDLDLTGAPDWVRDGFAVMDLLLEAAYLRW